MKDQSQGKRGTSLVGLELHKEYHLKEPILMESIEHQNKSDRDQPVIRGHKLSGNLSLCLTMVTYKMKIFIPSSGKSKS